MATYDKVRIVLYLGTYVSLKSQEGLGGCMSLSQTTKLLMLHSLLQEVCIDSDGSLTLSPLGLSVCLVSSYKVLNSGLKKAHSSHDYIYKYLTWSKSYSEFSV